MTYRIALAPSAARQLRKFDPQVRRRIQAALELLAAEPRPPAATRLVGGSGEWRVRTSDYRIVYEIEDDRLLILVLRIGHRREIYHFWRAVTVRGQFERITGEGSATEAGGLTGTLSFDATSLTTKNKQRDNHLRSADFFDIENHPMVVLAVTEAKPLDGGALACKGTLEAAGHLEPIEFTAHVQDLTDRAVTMTADLVVDRLRFGMTWSPIRIAAYDAHVTVTARFVRA